MRRDITKEKKKTKENEKKQNKKMTEKKDSQSYLVNINKRKQKYEHQDPFHPKKEKKKGYGGSHTKVK